MIISNLGLVGIGGVIGALLRYFVSRWVGVRANPNFPFATLAINISGSFLLGLFTRSLGIWLPQYEPAIMLLLGIGVCGAYTTFSTFSYEVVLLIEERRRYISLVYVVLTFLSCAAASALGLYGLPR